ncbi:MAG: hypothetical protein ACXWC7_01680 [Chitinophagaceae bacterium]
MKTNCILLSLLLFIFSTSSRSQSSYREGFVVVNSGDTIQGWIDYRQWDKNPDAIRFRQEITATDPVLYSINDLSYFEVTGFDKYERAVVSKDIRAVETSKLEKNQKDIFVTDTVFLRILIKAQISLYQLQASKAHYYIKEMGKNYEELLYKVYLTDHDTRLSKMYIFRDQLKQWIPISKITPSLTSLLKTADYNERDLTRIVEKINKLAGDVNMYKAKKPSQTLSWYVGAGIAYSSLSMNKVDDSNEMYEIMPTLDYSNSLQPLFAAGVDIGVARNNQKLILRLELAWYGLKYKGLSKPTSGDSMVYKLKVNSLSPSVSVLYNLINTQKNKLYVGGGAAFNMCSYPENSLTKKYYYSSTVHNVSPYLKLQKGWVSFHAKAGYLINKKIEIATSTKFGGSFSTDGRLGMKSSILFANINYHF